MNINSRIKQLLQISLVAIVLMSSGISVMAQTFDADNIAFGGINMPYRVAHTSGMGKPSLVIYLHGGTSKGNDINPAKRNVLDLKNETCKNREKRNVLKNSRTRHFKITKKQSKTGCFYSF